jgi:pimeloyl-ACP methyl ester carboxylesterase
LTPLSTNDLILSDGAIIRLRRHGVPGRTRILLSHGNGLAIDAYALFWAPLTRDYDLVVFDIRNHGQNPLHEPRSHTWPRIFADMPEIFQGIERCYGPARTVGAFHSLSALAALDSALRHATPWAALTLFDPPVVPPPDHRLMAMERADVNDLVRRTLRRPQRYVSPGVFAAQLARKPAFSRWQPEAFAALALHTLRETADGGWQLRNPRELEAYIFESKADAGHWQGMAQLRCPTFLIAGDPHSPFAAPGAHAARAIHEELGVEYAFVPHTTHFLQFEAPQVCRELMVSFLTRHALAN